MWIISISQKGAESEIVNFKNNAITLLHFSFVINMLRAKIYYLSIAFCLLLVLAVVLAWE